jgi:LysM repeat protein
MFPRLTFSRRVVVALALVLILLAVLVPVSQAAPAAQAPVTHIVRPGETVIGIAIRYGTSPWAIAMANGLANPNFIWAGQRLIIPVGPSAFVAPKGFPAFVPANYSYYARLAQQYAPLIRQFKNQWPGRWHTVLRGQSLASIAARYGSHPLVIALVNGLPNPNVIYPGQRLWVPSR